MSYYRNTKKKRRSSSIFIPVILGIIAVFGIVTYNIFANVMESTQTCTVLSKDRTMKLDNNGNSSSDMRVYTEDCGTFAVGDNWLKGVWNSADVFGSIQDGQRYTFTTTGFRIPIVSSFPSIIKVESVS